MLLHVSVAWRSVLEGKSRASLSVPEKPKLKLQQLLLLNNNNNLSLHNSTQLDSIDTTVDQNTTPHATISPPLIPSLIPLSHRKIPRQGVTGRPWG